MSRNIPKPAHQHEPSGPNPVLWVFFGVLAFTVVASFLLLYVSLRGTEPELPAHYRSEGTALDEDLARAAEARRLGARLTLDLSTADILRASLSFADPRQELPGTIELRLTHATLPELDRNLRLVADSTRGGYVARLDPLAPGHWLVQAAADSGWRLRGDLDSPVSQPVVLGR